MPNPDYRKIFGNFEPPDFKAEDLNNLALVMSGRTKFPDANPFVKFLTSAANFFFSAKEIKEEPKPIPAGYTYLAQFLIHDISFDSQSNRHTVAHLPFNDNSKPEENNILTPEAIDQLKNLRKQSFKSFITASIRFCRTGIGKMMRVFY